MAISQSVQGYFSLHGSPELPSSDIEKGTKIYGTFTPLDTKEGRENNISGTPATLTSHVWPSLAASLMAVTSAFLVGFLVICILFV